MTLQRHDFLLVDGERRRIAAASPVPFAPNAFGLRFAGMLGTHCYRGFWIDFELDRNVFKIKELRLSVHPDDHEVLLRGNLFDRKPDDATEFSATFKDVLLSYTGRLIVDQIQVAATAQQDMKEIFGFEEGYLRFREKVELRELPEEFTPSSVWVNYGCMLWVFPKQSEIEET